MARKLLLSVLAGLLLILPGTMFSSAEEAAVAPTADISPTFVPGDNLIDHDSVWSGTVSINGNVHVLSGVTLVIEPGTKVMFAVSPSRVNAAEDRIYVQFGGRLIARGTESQPIVFASATPGQKWFGIEIHSGDDKDSFAYCRVQDSRTGIACIKSSPIIEQSVFEDNQMGVSMWRQSKPIIRNCKFLRNEVAIKGGMQSSPTVSSCEIEGSTTLGISIEQDSGGVVEKSHFSRNKVGIAKQSAGDFLVTLNKFDANETGVEIRDEGASVALRENSFTDNQLGIYVATQAAPIISLNTFNKNRVAVSFDSPSRATEKNKGLTDKKPGARFSRVSNPGMDRQEGASAVVKENSFTDNEQGVSVAAKMSPVITRNTFNKTGTAILFDGPSRGSVSSNDFTANKLSIRVSRSSSPGITLNLFSKNDTAIFCEYSSNPGITRNRFSNNDKAILCEYSSYPTIAENNFLANTTDIRVGDNQSFEWTRSIWPDVEWEQWANSYGKNKILARNNYWGEETTRKMQAGSKQIESLFDYHQSKEILVNKKAYRRDEIDYRPFSLIPIKDAEAAGRSTGE